MSDASPWPSEIRLNPAKDVLTLTYDDGKLFTLAAEYLRVESPSAEVQGHGPNERKTVAGKRDIKISKLEPVGNYAVRILFDDGHDTGLYSWLYLRTLGEEQAVKWPSYLQQLALQGLSR